MSTDSQTQFATIVMVLVAIFSLGCNAQSPQTQFSVPDLVYSVDISNDENLVAVGSRGDNRENLTVFDVKRDAKLWSVGAGRWVWDVAFSPDQKWLVSGSDSGLQVWDVRGGRAPEVLPSPPLTVPEVKHLSISPQGNFLAASRGYKIELWDFPNRKFLRFIPTIGGGTLVFSQDEKWLAVCGSHNRLEIHDVESGALLGAIEARVGELSAGEFSSDGRRLVTCFEGVTKVFCLEKNGAEVVLTELETIRSSLGADISANGKWLASGGHFGKVSINEVSSGRTLSSFQVANGNDSIYATKFSKDNTQVVVGGMLRKDGASSGTVQIWNLSDVLDLTDTAPQE